MQVLKEQRLDIRFGKSVPVQVQLEDSSSFTGETINLSSRGLSCHVPCYVPSFSRLSLRIEMLSQARGLIALQLDALVVRIEKSQGLSRMGGYILGVFFLHLDKEKAALINDFLAEVESCDSPIISKTIRKKGVRGQGSCLSSEFNPQGFLQDYKLTRLDRLACLGELSSVLAHEIKNPLACLAGSLQILGDEIKEIHPSEDLFSELFGQIERIDNIVDHLLQFSTTESPQMKLVRVEDVINGTLCLLGGKLKEKNIQVDLCHGFEQPFITADERLLRQAFLNIFANLVDSMEVDGNFSVNTYWVDKESNCDRASCECFARDENKGISVVVMNSSIREKNIQKKSMMPLSLAERKKRGLNLSLSQQIIEQHQGSVFIQSQPQENSVLLVTLPI